MKPVFSPVTNPLTWLAIAFASLSLLLTSCEKEPESNPGQPFIEAAESIGSILKLEGTFGDDPGAEYRSVLIDNQAIPNADISAWQADNIICSFDSELKDQITVQVISKGVKSNVKTVTLKKPAMKINYLQVWEEYSWLYIYGEGFGTDPGAGKRSVTVKGVPVNEITAWTPNLITCSIPRQSNGAFGEVVVKRGDETSAPRKLYRWFMNLKYEFPQSGLGGSMLEKADFHIPIRGDIGELPLEGYIDNDGNDVFTYSYADYSMKGSGHSTYEGCNYVDISWEETLGDWPLISSKINAAGNSHFQATIDVARDQYDENWNIDGFDLYLNFDVVGATTATKTYTFCNGMSNTDVEPQMIDFVTFDHKKIPLRFSGTDIQGDTLKAINVASTAGFIWDQSNYQANLVTVTLSWKTTKAEW